MAFTKRFRDLDDAGKEKWFDEKNSLYTSHFYDRKLQMKNQDKYLQIKQTNKQMIRQTDRQTGG